VIGIISSVGVFAQNDDKDSLIHLGEVVVTQTRLQNYAVGHYLQHVDSAVSRLATVSNAAELLRKFGFGHIRSYGVGGVTTPSFRGTGASHTAVLWNGINIISPLNGQSDLSLLPVSFIDDVQLQSGGSATLYGSGAIGGTIQFNNKAVFKQGLNVSLTENIGSFKTFFHGLSATWSGHRWISSTKVFQTSAENNFSFLNRNFSTPREEVRQHNAVEQHGVLQQNYFQVNEKNLLSFRFWYQDNHYEIPEPTTVSQEGVSTQRDKFIRSTLGWNHDYNNGHLFVQSAFVHHVLDYRNPNIIPSVSISTFNSLITMIENTLNVGNNIEWTSGINVTHEEAIANELGNKPYRNREALYTAFKYEKGKWRNVLSARWEMVEDKYSPLSPSLGVEYKAHRFISPFANISRNYRIPTFNDLYWNDASSRGNPNLHMETSWSEELGFKLSIPTKAFHLTGQLAAFSNKVDDMIYWRQDSGKWSPVNLRKAWTRGIETMGTIKRTAGKFSGEITQRYSYTVATTEAVYDPRKANEIGNQLVFTPKHESGTTLRLTWSSWQFSVTNNYTGRQFTDDDNKATYILKAYNVTNLWISKDLPLKNLSMMIMGEVNNLFDNEVSTRPGYPLPGRNFKAGLTIKFNKPIRR
jgi:iron complex outermembrane receptor protein